MENNTLPGFHFTSDEKPKAPEKPKRLTREDVMGAPGSIVERGDRKYEVQKDGSWRRIKAQK